MYKSGYISYYFLFLKIKIKTITKHKILFKNVTTQRINIVYMCRPLLDQRFFFHHPGRVGNLLECVYVCRGEEGFPG